MKKALFAGAMVALLCTSQAQAIGRNSDKNLKRATAIFIGNTPTDSVTLLEVKRKMMSVKWRAQTPSGIYDCDADDMVQDVNCVKATTAVANNK